MKHKPYNSEIPKYRKKKQKKYEEKADHKHDYRRVKILKDLKVCSWRTKEKIHWTLLLTACSICGKEKEEHITATEEEFQKIIKEINMGEYPNG